MLALALSSLLAAAPTCEGRGTLVLVDTSTHRMLLCHEGSALKTYAVALGSGGVAGARVGWAQTPLGRFVLDAPRPSSSYHLFVPLGNPDPRRFSAWAIGLHGPPRANVNDGPSVVASDWTWGCIAVATDAEIDEVAAFVRERKVRVAVFV